MAAGDPFCPYVGLRPYTEKDREYFFGRERDQRIIASNLYAASLTVLYGVSGVGKSSVLLAKVVPFLRAQPRTAVVVFREWQNPAALQALKRECLEAVQTAHGKRLSVEANLPLDELLHQAAREFGGTILVLLDQFEEYFLYHPPSAVDEGFDAEFARAVNREEVEANFLISLREDALSKLDRFRARIPNLLGNTLCLRHLDPASAEEAIRKPLGVYNAKHAPDAAITVENELVRAVLVQVRTAQAAPDGWGRIGPGSGRGAADEIETPILQLVMTRLWEEERASHSCVLRLGTLERLGGAQRIAETHLDGVLVKLNAGEQEVCALCFDRLVTPSGSKIAYPVNDLVKLSAGLAGGVPSVLKTLSDERILRVLPAPADQPEASRVEILHDVLAPAVRDWRRRYVERQVQEKIRQEEQERHEHELARIERERAMESARRMRKAVFALVGIIVVILALMFFALVQQREALRQREEALSAQREAKLAKDLAQQRLDRIVEGIRLKEAVLSGDQARIQAALDSSQRNRSIVFTASAKPYSYKNPSGQQVYKFTLSVDANSVPEGLKSIAFITYRMDHPTFQNTLLATGPDRKFTASYDGWGCLSNVTAVIEYLDPDKLPEIAAFDMCKALGWGHSAMRDYVPLSSSRAALAALHR